MKICSYETALTGLHPYTKKHVTGHHLFLDIETTGLSKERHQIYLIGCAYFTETDTLITRQFFAENADEEALILQEFLHFCRVSEFSSVITFNGDSFDLRFLQKKAELHQIDFPLSFCISVDLLKEIKPLRFFFQLANLRQKTLEQFLGIDREDEYDGGRLIQVYQNYVKHPLPDFLHLLLLHNREDIENMPRLICILAYRDFLKSIPQTTAVIDRFVDISGNIREELLVTIQNPDNLPGQFHSVQEFSGIHILKNHRGFFVRIPLENHYIKCYYKDYKNYYYLPAEDQAIHKSVAAFVDKENRQKATPQTCYTKLYVTEEFLQSPQLNDYIHHTLSTFLQ